MSSIIRDAVRRDGRPLSTIAAEAHISPQVLSRFMREERGLTLATVERLTETLKLELK